MLWVEKNECINVNEYIGYPTDEYYGNSSNKT